MSKEILIPKLSDVDEALQSERNDEVDEQVLAKVQKLVRRAGLLDENTETLPTPDGGVVTLITS